MQLQQRQSPALHPLTTAHLAQTMSLLELPTVELRQKIEADLGSNPALELIEAKRCPNCHRMLDGKRTCPFCSRSMDGDPEQPVIFLSHREDFYPSPRGSRYQSLDGDLPEDNVPAEVESLPAFVLSQIAPDLEPDDRVIAAHILTALDDDGLLGVPLLEIARYHYVPLSRVEKVLRLIQHAEPPGVGSPSPQEALLVQLDVLAETRPVPSLAAKMIKEGMDLLSRRRYSSLAHLLGISSAEARRIAQFIGDNLHPYPARTHWGRHNRRIAPQPNVYYNPDVIISKMANQGEIRLVVEVALPVGGTLRINPLFREALKQAPPEKSEQWMKDLEQASLLVKCIQQRNHTMVRLMERLAILQREFILQGDAHLHPLTRAQLAGELGLHESTISRAVADKAVQLPNGHITPLAKFFDRSLHIRTTLKQIISQETRPLSDSELARRLSKEGYQIARRTVAKYRSMEGILPAHLRGATPSI
jgi:RNA polymerase sigma-54 factor